MAVLSTAGRLLFSLSRKPNRRRRRKGRDGADCASLPKGRAFRSGLPKGDFRHPLRYRLTVPSCPVAIGEVFANKYRVDKILGEGGMGVVVLAHHLELDQPVAIKFLLDDIAVQDEGAERFRREARAAAKIQSDHVVRVLDVGIMDGGVRYMVMEYLEGKDLAEELAEKRTFPVGVAAGFILEAIDAIARAHAVGIVHRDLKPANLFLARRADGSQRIKVLDFGISKSIGTATAEEMSLTKTSAWIGSPLYMAPEQMQSARDVDHRADIWSLGAILYELISGRPPYLAESLPQLCNLLITTDPDHLLTHCPACPQGLAEAVMGCLVRDPTQRTQSVGELARGLAAYATTITGTGMGRAIMDRTEVQMSAPPSQLALGYSTGPTPVVSTGPRPSLGAKTSAAWGATDDGSASDKRPSPKMGFAIVALVAAAAAGFFIMRSGSSPEESESPVAAGVAAPIAEDEKPESSTALPSPEKADPEPPQPEIVAPPEPAVAPAPAPAPVPVVALRPKPAPTVKPKPAPQPTTKPAPSDDFADFGGRR